MFKSRTIILRIVGLFASCVLILVGILLLRQSSIVPGIVITIVAILMFVLTAFFNEKYPMEDEDAQAFKPYLVPAIFWLGSAVSLIYTIYAMSIEQGPSPAEYWVSAAWLGSLLFLIIGMLWISHWHFPKWIQIKEWFSPK